MGNLGNDLMLDENNDFIFGLNGDFYTTEDEEAFMDDLPFEGYVALRQFVSICLDTVLGTLNPYDIDFGIGARLLVSRNIAEVFPEFVERVQEQLLKDDRIQSVIKCDYEIADTNMINVFVSILAVGQNVSSNFVFPYQIV